MTTYKKSLLALLFTIFCDQTAVTITFPLVTLLFFDMQSRLFAIDTSYTIRSFAYGFCVALPQMINMFCAPALSILSDTIGRKKILTLEILSAAIFTLIVGLGVFSGKLWLVLLGYLIKGAFVRTNPTALAMVGDIAPYDKKILAMGYLQCAISIGAFVGPLLGGFLAHRYFFSTYNFSLPFFCAALIAFINFFGAKKILPESLTSQSTHFKNHLNLSALKTIFFHPSVLRISILLFLIQLSWSMYYQFIPPYLKVKYFFNASDLGWFIGLIAFWLALATSLGLKILYPLMTSVRLLTFSLYAMLVGLILTIVSSLFTHSLLFWLGAIPVAAGDVIAYSCLTTYYSNAVAKEAQGRVMGVGFIIVSLAWTITGLSGGWLMSFTPLMPLAFAPIGVFAAIIFLMCTGKKLFQDA